MKDAVRTGLVSALVTAVLGAGALWKLGHFDWRLAAIVAAAVAFTGFRGYRREQLRAKYPGLDRLNR